MYMTQGNLDHYAYMIHGLIQLYMADFDRFWITWACDLVQIVNTHFWDEVKGGYLDS